MLGLVGLRLVVLSTLAVLSGSCSKSDSSAAPIPPLASASASAAPAQKTFTAGFIYVGPKGDYGYNQAHA